MALRFTGQCHFDGNRDAVRFEAFDGEQRVHCAVSHEALTDVSGDASAAGSALEDIYRAYAGRIHEIADRKYSAGIMEDYSLVLIMSGDLNR